MIACRMADKTIEEFVGGVDDLKDGEMKEVEVGGTKVLLFKSDGKFHATGAKCSHYGAPLAKGVFCDGTVRCPWHGACFNVATGDIEDYPGLDSIPTFDVEVVDGKVRVKAKKGDLENHKRVRNMLTTAPTSKTTVLIIGGGPSATVCAETLRQEGFQGRIVMATKENHLPYDRPKLSKALDIKADQITLRDKNFFSKYHIEVMLGKEATAVDLSKKSVKFKDGKSLTYDKLVLATGTSARVLTMIPGYDLKNVLTLRTVDDAHAIAASAAEKNVVIIGTSFIGMEVAAALAGKASSITVIDMSETPFQATLGKEIGAAIQKVLEEKGVQFRFKTNTDKFVGKKGKLTEVVLKDGTVLPADVCVVGAGVLPVTDFLKDSGLTISDRGFLVVNKMMETNQEGVYAIGDVAQFPLFLVNNESVNIQHWQMAHQHGRICGLNIAGKRTEIHSVPFFWTMLCGKSLRYTGYGFGYDDIVIHGDVAELKFVAFYTKGDKVIAIATMNNDPIAAQAAQVLLREQIITKAEIKADALGWISKLSTPHCASTHF